MRWLAYLMFLCAVLEIATRFLVDRGWIARLLQGDYDPAWRWEWYERHLHTGTNIYYGFDAFDPVLGWKLQPNLRNAPMYDGKQVNSNSRGLRGTSEYRYTKDPSGRLRVLVIGDSYTFGDGLDDHETYAAQLGPRMPGAEVINMGIHGYGHDQILLYFQREGFKYHPDIVVLGFVYYDLDRNLLGFRDYAKPHFNLTDDKLLPDTTYIPAPEDMMDKIRERSYFLDLLTIIREKTESRMGWRQERKEELGRALLNKLADEIIATGAKPVFVYIPTGEEIFDPRRSENWENFFLRFAGHRKDVACFSLRDALRQKKNQLKFNGHWGPQTNGFIADSLAVELGKLVR